MLLFEDILSLVRIGYTVGLGYSNKLVDHHGFGRSNLSRCSQQTVYLLRDQQSLRVWIPRSSVADTAHKGSEGGRSPNFVHPFSPDN